MGGIQFLEQVGRIDPEICTRTIVIPGDAVNPVTAILLNRSSINVLHKPFDLKDLQRHAKLILEHVSNCQWGNS